MFPTSSPLTLLPSTIVNDPIPDYIEKNLTFKTEVINEIQQQKQLIEPVLYLKKTITTENIISLIDFHNAFHI